MSVYMNKIKVAPAFKFGADENALSAEDLKNLNEAVNYRVGEFTTKTVSQMIARMKEHYLTERKPDMDIDLNGNDTWVRPQGWPDLDSLNLTMSGDDYIYMTYDASQELSAIALYCVTVSGSPAAVVTMGHIDNGTYIVDEIISKNNSNHYIRWLDDVSGYPVVRVTGNIKYCYAIDVTNADGQKQSSKNQPIIERIAYVPHLDYFSSTWGTWSLQREKVGNGEGSLLKSISDIYNGCYNLQDLDISNLHTSNVTTMNGAFLRCYKLNKTLDLRHFDVKKVTTFFNMFSNCLSLPYINLTGWETDNVTNLQSMFESCLNLKRIYGIENFKTNKCTTFYNTFNSCWSLKELKLNNWVTNKVTTFNYLFANCYNLVTLEISNWETTSLTLLSNTFSTCWSLEKLDLSNWNVSKVTNVGGLFNGCFNLKQLNITGWKINSTTSFSYVFNSCYCLEHIDISDWHITNTCTTIYQAFNYCISLKELDIPNDWDVSGLSSSNSTANSLFSNCWSLKRITGISNWNFQLNNSLVSMFAYCYSLENIDVSGWNVSTTTSLASLFSNCYSLKEINLSSWVPTNCTNISNMFANCYSLETVNLTNFVTNNCTTFASMFAYCRNLKTISGNLNSWNTSNVTTLGSMFAYAHSLSGPINISNWNVSKVTTTDSMFTSCYNIKEINLSNWTLTKCTTINSMFRYCYSLTSLTLTNWSLPALTTNPTDYFNDCYLLKNYNGLPIPLSHSCRNTSSLSHTSLINILTALPQVNTSRTLTLGSVNLNKLTTTDKAIATNKGWTLAT